MADLPNCPKCDEAYTYEDGAVLVCPMCEHEWPKDAPDAAEAAGESASHKWMIRR